MASKLTVLEMVQDIMSAMESDEVNSISDTVESLQVAQEIKTTYFELIATFDIPSNEELVSLDGLSDPAQPNVLRIPDHVKAIKWLKYDNGTYGVQDLKYLEPEDFLRRSLNFVGQNTHIKLGRFYVGTNSGPTWWTTFDNEHLILDSVNLNVDTTAQASKTLCWASVYPQFKMEDDFVPDLDAMLFPLFLSEAKKSCFINFKQVANANEERRSRRQMVRAQKDLWRADQRRPYNKTPDYGRHRGSGSLPKSTGNGVINPVYNNGSTGSGLSLSDYPGGYYGELP